MRNHRITCHSMCPSLIVLLSGSAPGRLPRDCIVRLHTYHKSAMQRFNIMGTRSGIST